MPRSRRKVSVGWSGGRRGSAHYDSEAKRAKHAWPVSRPSCCGQKGRQVTSVGWSWRVAHWCAGGLSRRRRLASELGRRRTMIMKTRRPHPPPHRFQCRLDAARPRRRCRGPSGARQVEPSERRAEPPLPRLAQCDLSSSRKITPATSNGRWLSEIERVPLGISGAYVSPLPQRR
jgi:hypothetical protein